MNVHLHYIRCPLQEIAGHASSISQKCVEFEAYEHIYSNQIAISLTIDGKENFPSPVQSGTATLAQRR
jgi:hypothetical protein